MRSAIVRIDESRVEVELIDLVIFRSESLGWHFRYPQVAVLRQLHVYHNGETWVEVMASTNQGWRKGWVMRNHLDSCNCPTY